MQFVIILSLCDSDTTASGLLLAVFANWPRSCRSQGNAWIGVVILLIITLFDTYLTAFARK